MSFLNRVGEAGKDRINGGYGYDKIFGGDNDDVIYSSDGYYKDTVDGGQGYDSAKAHIFDVPTTSVEKYL